MTYTLVMAEALVKAILLRLPLDLHKTLSEWAREERRSLSAQIIVILEQAAAARG